MILNSFLENRYKQAYFHLGYEKHQESKNQKYRNCHNKKLLKLNMITIPRDIDGTFELCDCTFFEKTSYKKREINIITL